MRILLLGQTGQLGSELTPMLARLGSVVAADRRQLDLAKPDAISSVVREVKPDLIVNAAAYTAVDKAESEPEIAMAINGIAPGIMAEEAKRIGALFLHYSTDYVFDGIKGAPYREDDEPRPVNVYGRTKGAGERAIVEIDGASLILRTSWLYGARRDNFLTMVLRSARQGGDLAVVDDQFGSPTWCQTPAAATAAIVQYLVEQSGERNLASGLQSALQGGSGVFHCASQGSVSRYEFARMALGRCAANGQFEIRGGLIPSKSSQSSSAAKRPKNSSLDVTKLQTTFGIVPERWDVELGRFLHVQALALKQLVDHP